jgi:hypothetical protein
MNVSQSIRDAGVRFQSRSDTAFLKGDLLQITDFAAYDTAVKPGDTLNLVTRVQNHAASVQNVSDADACGLSQIPCGAPTIGNGYCTMVEWDFEWGERFEAGSDCVGDLTSGDTVRDFETSFTAPQTEGTYTIRTRMVLNGSGVESDWVERELLVSEDAPEEPTQEEPGGGESPANQPGQFKQIRNILALALVFVLVLQVSG